MAFYFVVVAVNVVVVVVLVVLIETELKIAKVFSCVCCWYFMTIPLKSVLLIYCIINVCSQHMIKMKVSYYLYIIPTFICKLDIKPKYSILKTINTFT